MCELKHAVTPKTWLLHKLIRMYTNGCKCIQFWICICWDVLIIGDFKHMILTVGLPHYGSFVLTSTANSYTSPAVYVLKCYEFLELDIPFQLSETTKMALDEKNSLKIMIIIRFRSQKMKTMVHFSHSKRRKEKEKINILIVVVDGKHACAC